jgi:Tol biopolymer transport system component/DNA-binding winged helix-turn-helix (wHTH) protein
VRPLYRFDDVALDMEGFRLTRRGEPVHLEPKVLELLGYLVANRGRLVEKPELQAAVWRDTAVSDSALTRAVAQLRKALDDDAREARYVETVPTRGYRFRGEVRVEEGRNGSATTLETLPSPARSPEPETKPAGRMAATLAAIACLLLALLAAALLGRRAPTSPEPRPAREARRMLVSTSRGYNAFPTFSPDGGTLAFVSDRSGRLEIYTRALAAGARELPITSDGQDNVQPAWSPDGRHLAYHSMRRGGIWLVPALGGAPRQISEFGSAPAWSPDGRRIAFASLGLAALEAVSQFSSCLYVVDVAGDDVQGAPRRLTDPGRPQTGHGPPVFTPDGRDVLFVAEGVWAVRSDGSAPPRQLVEGWPADVAIAPDGRTLYWSSWDRGTWNVWQAPYEPGAARTGARSSVVGTGDHAPRHLTVSRTGRLAFGLTFLTSEIAVLPLQKDGSAAGPPAVPWPGGVGRKLYLQFSRDGRTLAFTRSQPGQAREIWGVDVASGAARVLVPALEVGFLSGYFPDDQDLLVASQGTTKRLLRVPLSGGRPEPLMPAETMGWARLLPPGQEVVFHSVVDGTLDVHRVRLDGTGSRRLTQDGQGAGWPVPSPDGRTVAVELFRGNDTQIALIPAEGGATPRVLTSLPGQHWIHDWSPDGRRVLYSARRESLWNIYWMDVASGEEHRLTDQGRVRDAVRTPAWSPVGDRIAYEQVEVTAGVWVVDLEPVPAVASR